MNHVEDGLLKDLCKHKIMCVIDSRKNLVFWLINSGALSIERVT